MKLIKYNKNNVNYPTEAKIVNIIRNFPPTQFTQIIISSDSLPTEPSHQPIAEFTFDDAGVNKLRKFVFEKLGDSSEFWVVRILCTINPLDLSNAIDNSQELNIIYPTELPRSSSKQVQLFSVGRTNGPTDKDIMRYIDENNGSPISYRYDVNSRIEILKSGKKLTFTFRPLKEKNMAKITDENKREAVILQSQVDLWLLGLHVLLNQWDKASEIVNTII